jgi:hypothetical protein
MPFEHACFISYRHHEQSQLAERFILDLFGALRNELTLMVEEDIFVDRERMKGGTFFNPALANALCKSICMIMIYTPTYFSSSNTYCAREYRAMEMLEAARLSRLKDQKSHEAGLIIPIILRGSESLPEMVRKHRQYYTFERFSLSSRELARNRQFEDRVREIASVIHARKRALAPWSDELTSDCNCFTFPSEEEIHPWLEKIIPSTNAFPFR